MCYNARDLGCSSAVDWYCAASNAWIWMSWWFKLEHWRFDRKRVSNPSHSRISSEIHTVMEGELIKGWSISISIDSIDQIFVVVSPQCHTPAVFTPPPSVASPRWHTRGPKDQQWHQQLRCVMIRLTTWDVSNTFVMTSGWMRCLHNLTHTVYHITISMYIYIYQPTKVDAPSR